MGFIVWAAVHDGGEGAAGALPAGWEPKTARPVRRYRCGTRVRLQRVGLMKTMVTAEDIVTDWDHFVDNTGGNHREDK